MRKLHLAAPNIAAKPEQLLAEARVNLGMVTTIDSVDIENSALTFAKEARCRIDKICRRPGKTNDAPAKPNTNKILGLYVFKKNTGLLTFLRFTRNSIHQRNIGSWTNYTAGTNGSLTGSDSDYFSTAVVLNNFFFANGVDKVQIVDPSGPTYKEAGLNSPKVKYVTGFYNRVVGAYRVEGSQVNGPVTIVWCADGDSTKWPDDASPDISSGQSPIVESPSDLADFITGIFGGPSYLLLTRERSIWAATKLPSGSNPFYFATAVPGIGADCPKAIKVIPNGLMWLDIRTGQVYGWTVGSVPEEIGTKVYSDIIKSVNDPSQIISSYSQVEREFSLGVVIPNTTIVRVWTFNRRTNAWVYDEIDTLSCIADIDNTFTSAISIDELVGSTDALSGTMDSLGVTSSSKVARYFGYNNGDILIEDASVDTDNGVAYTTDIQSKDFHQPGIDTYFSRIKVECLAKIDGTITLSYSKDRGKTFKVAKVEFFNVNETKSITFVRCVKAKQLRWRITASDGSFDILEYSIHVQPSGNTTENK